MRWHVHSEREVYASEWVRLVLADVEVPNGERFEHHVVRMPSFAVGTVVHDLDRGLLLLHRHRFITDTWGWEIPAGRAEAGETPTAAAARETLEETGWAPGPLTPLMTYHPQHGLSDQRFLIFVARGASHVGEPSDPGESDRVEWRSLDEVRDLVARGEMPDGLSLTAVLWFLQFADT
jgi:8-oxo-dGTP pyrophosphatase MutT (NUDIX family)